MPSHSAFGDLIDDVIGPERFAALHRVRPIMPSVCFNARGHGSLREEAAASRGRRCCRSQQQGDEQPLFATRKNNQRFRVERVHSARKARTGSIDAARSAGMKPAIAAADTSMAMAMVMTGTLTLVIS